MTNEQLRGGPRVDAVEGPGETARGQPIDTGPRRRDWRSRQLEVLDGWLSANRMERGLAVTGRGITDKAIDV